MSVRALLTFIWQESHGNPAALGGAGEIGLMQIKPSTAGDFGFSRTQLDVPEQNIHAGGAYFAWLLEPRSGYSLSTFDAVRAYNAGYTGATVYPERGRDYANQWMNKLTGTRGVTYG